MSLTNSFGQLIEIYNYKNGNLEGEYKEYHENGQLSIICNYTNGQLIRICNYKNEKKIEI